MAKDNVTRLPVNLEQTVEDGTPQVLRLINENRNKAFEGLAKKTEALQATLDNVREYVKQKERPLFTALDNDDQMSDQVDHLCSYH